MWLAVVIMFGMAPGQLVSTPALVEAESLEQCIETASAIATVNMTTGQFSSFAYMCHELRELPIIPTEPVEEDGDPA